MGRSLSPILQREFANLDKDAESRRSAMKTLKTYAKDLDSKAIPQFLAQVSDTKGPISSKGECTISLFEVLARVHGRNIVPQIDNIMTTIIRTLSSSAGSFPLHQACSKVVPSIARYGIDPSTPEDEKVKIICCLCKPLSDVLMGGSQESLASGAALCLKALVDSTNWKYASEDLVNEVCLKVAGALEEKITQTNSHMGLVMALAKHNVFTVEAYARSLIRSGLQILSTGVSENNSQKRFSAIQMINFLIKCVDSRSINSEIDKVVDIMDKCQGDHMPYVRGAAFEALQTAKFITSQKGSKHETSLSPVTSSNFYLQNDRSPRVRRDNVAEFASPESPSVVSCLTYDAFTDSPISTGQSSNFEGCNKRSSRRLWNNDLGGVDISLKDGLLFKSYSDREDSKCNEELNNTDKVRLESFSGFVHARPTKTSRDTAPSPKSSLTQLTIDNMMTFTSPRKLVRSLQNATEEEHVVQNENSISARVESGGQVKEASVVEDEYIVDGIESVSSTDDIPAQKVFEERKDNTEEVQMKVPSKRTWHGKAALGFSICGLLMVFLAMIFSAMRTDNDEILYGVVPT